MGTARGQGVTRRAKSATLGGMIHIRRRLPRKGGNQWYRSTLDRSVHAATFRGAEVTDKDLEWRQGRTRWARENACPACLEAHDAERADSHQGVS